MIKSFRCKETEKVFHRAFTKKIPSQIQDTALRRMIWLNAATKLEDLLSPPGNQLEKLKGDRRDQYSIRINAQYRICFKWEDGNSFDVEIVDYH